MFWLINAGEATVGRVAPLLGARLPSFVGLLLALWAVHGIGALWAGAATGRRAVAVLSTSWLFWQVGGMGQIDALLTGLELSAVLLLLRCDRDGRPRGRWGAFALMGLAVLAKGPVGFVVPLGTYLAATLATGERPRLKAWEWAGGIALALALPLGWIAACRWGGAPESYLRELLFTQNVERAAGELGHRRPLFYYAFHAPISFLPWTLCVPVAYRKLGEVDRPLRRRLVAWVLFVVGLFSLSASKRHLYILPAFPAAAIGVAAAASAVEASRACRRLATALLGLVALGGAVAACAFAFPSFVLRLEPRPEHVRYLRSVAAWPFALLALSAAAGLVGVRHREAVTGRWLDAHCVALALVAAVAGGAVLPAFNAIKAPMAMTGVADTYVPRNGHILLFRMNGESLALYARRRGERVDTEDALRGAVARQGRGVVVIEEKLAADIERHVPDAVARGHLHMGSKGYVWLAFGPPERRG